MGAPAADWTTQVNRLQDDAQDAFSQPVTFRPASGTSQIVTGIFDAEHEVADLNGDVEVSGFKPVLEVQLSKLSQAPLQGDQFDIAGTTYEVTDVQPDGRGSAMLMLLIV